MAKRDSKRGDIRATDRTEQSPQNYASWLSESVLEEGPFGDLGQRFKRAGKRAVAGAKSFARMGQDEAEGEFDVLDVSAKLRKHYLRDCKAIGAPVTMQSLADFLLNKYGVHIDPKTAKILNDNPRETAHGEPAPADPDIKTSGTHGKVGPNSFSTGAISNKNANPNITGFNAGASSPGKVTATATNSTTGPSGTPEEVANRFWAWVEPILKRAGATRKERLDPAWMKKHYVLWAETQGIDEGTRTRAAEFVSQKAEKYEQVRTGQAPEPEAEAPQDASAGEQTTANMDPAAAAEAGAEAADETANTTPAEAPQQSRSIAAPLQSKEAKANIQQVALSILTANPDPSKVMMAIQRLISAAKRSPNQNDRAYVSNWLRTMRDNPNMIRKVPQFREISDADLKKLSENWDRLVSCTLFLVEEDVREPKLVMEAVDHFFFEAFNPEAKIDRATIDKVLTNVAHFLNAAGAVHFKGKESGPKIGPVNRGDADGHVRRSGASPGGLDAVTAARTGRSASSTVGTTKDRDGDGIPDDRDTDDGRNISATLDVRHFEDTLLALGMTGEEITKIFKSAKKYRSDPDGLLQTLNTPDDVTWAKRIAAAAMISILVNAR